MNFSRFILCVVTLLVGLSARAEVRLPNLISDGMVLQRGTPVHIWGWAAPGEKVTVTFAKQEQTGTADAQGRWRVELRPLPAGGPYEMTVASGNTITVRDILVGEVWVAAGQSNMEVTMGWPPLKRPDEIAQADWPQIREFAVPTNRDITPHDQTAGAWQICSPKTVPGFGAVSYFFARELHQQLRVPVGIIRSTVGGTRIEAWISREGLQTEPVLQEAVANCDRDSAIIARSPKELKVDDATWMKTDFDDGQWKPVTLPAYWDWILYPMEYDYGVLWVRRSVEIPAGWAGKRLRLELTVDRCEITALYFNGQKIGRATPADAFEIPAELVKAGKVVIALCSTKSGEGGIYSDPAKLRLVQADDPQQQISLVGVWKFAAAALGYSHVSPKVPASVYNAMIAPLVPFTIRGALWYQGEANVEATSAFNYRKMLPTLIGDWRAKWQRGNFPFYIVQLPNYGAPSNDPNQTSELPVLRESQAEALAVPDTGMAVTIDTGDGDLHPPNKWDVGKRLALAALETTYDQKVHGQSPLYESLTVEGNQARIHFTHADDGLMTKDGGPVKGFAIAGADGKFVWAEAVTDGNTVLVSNDKVPNPVAVRYAWGDNPVCNLHSKVGLPVAPFRTSGRQFADDFNNRTKTISLGEPLGPGWAVSTTPNKGGTWSVADSGYAQPNIAQAHNGAQYVSGVDLATTAGWKLSIDLMRSGQPATESGGKFWLLANWNGKELVTDGGCIGLVFEVDCDPLQLRLFEKHGNKVTTLWESQHVTPTKQFAANTNFFYMGYWDHNFVTFTLQRRGNKVLIQSAKNAAGVNDFNSGWLTTTLPNTGFVGIDYSYTGRALPAFDNFVWVDVPERVWVAEENAAKVMDVKFAYFPYSNTIKTRVDVKAVGESDKVRQVKLSVRQVFGVPPSGGIPGTNQTPTKVGTLNTKKIVTTQIPVREKYTAGTEWKIPPLKEGRYEFVVESTEVKSKPIVVDFVRHVMPWEHNRLGKSDVVIAPFEPIRVQGQKLSTVLRTHTLNNLGLFDQVESLGQPLLKLPMRLEVNGVPVTGTKLRFIEKTPTRVVTESRCSAGTTRTEWDYDGLMKWTLDLPVSKTTVESMILIVPLDDKLMPLFHSCTFSIRNNYAGFTPAGQGRVWESTKTGSEFVPYLWLGAEERGLAVFGENDRGWVRDPKVPCQELVRHGDTLELRLHLIAAPTKLEQARRIVIGFQATPTKPMPEGWRTWTMGGGGSKDVAVDISFSGTSLTMGTLGPCYELYPRNEDFSLYDQLAETRRTGVADEKFIEHWIAGYPQGLAASYINSWRPHIQQAFQLMRGKPDGVRRRLLQYTNARGVRLDTPEGQTFLDEWHRDAFPTRVWSFNSAVWYDMDPVESFRDYAMWYYQKLLDTWVDDIYWDNVYLQANFDTVGTEAYELPDGTIQPSCGLWNLRELIRRTAVFNHERKKRGFNQPHMTNAQIVPILSFAGTQLSWEDREGDTDFQDRFSREYIRAESIGRQSGNVPFLLTLINGPDEKKNTWAKRTNAGVTLTHEIKPQTAYHYSPDYWSNFQRLLEFGYGKPETRAWNYWDANYPAHIEGSETSSLVVSKPGRAIIVVCDYGNGGDLKLTFDLSAKFTAKDMESGQPLTVTGNTVQFPLKKHDFKMILVESL